MPSSPAMIKIDERKIQVLRKWELIKVYCLKEGDQLRKDRIHDISQIRIFKRRVTREISTTSRRMIRWRFRWRIACLSWSSSWSFTNRGKNSQEIISRWRRFLSITNACNHRYTTTGRTLMRLHVSWYLPSGGSWESCWPCRRYPG